MTDPFEERLTRVLGGRADAVRAAPDPAAGARDRARRRRRRTSALAAGFAVVVVIGVVVGAAALRPGDGPGPIDTPTTPSPTPDPDLPVLMVDGEVQVSCRGAAPGWPASVMADGVPGVLGDAEARAAFQDILDDPGRGIEAELSLFPEGTDVEYRVLHHDGDDLLVGLGPWTDEGPGRGASTLRLHDEGDRWSTDGWSSCTRLSPTTADGVVWAEVRRARATSPTRVALEVSEQQCASGRDPSSYLHEPVVVEGDDSVTVYWTTTPSGRGFCPANPWVDRTVELAAPLGDRVIRDGSFWPPRVISGP